MVAVALGLAAGISWGVADFLGGLKSRQLNVVAVLVISQAAGALLVGLIVAARGQGPPELHFLLYGVLGGVAGLVGLAAFYRGMAVGAMAVVAPISATGAAIPVAVGLSTGDRPSAIQVVGLVLAMVGVVLASREGGEGAGGARLAAGTGLALVAALGFGAFFVGLDAASDGDVLWALLAARSFDVILLCALAVTLGRGARMSARDLRDVVAVGLLDVLANALFALASTRGLVSLVAVLASLYPVVTIFLARLVLKERIRASQGAGVALALVGVAAIASG
ncbi:MAG: DMT family transporter [Thermoleophilaceae bacterium]|nr:DMT family transporter [Thermoleophilaceae bacterium]